MLAGAVVFDNGRVMHTQYLSSSEPGRAVGALDLVIDHVIEQARENRRFCSFGISTEQGGGPLNEGLIRQKEGFGGRGFTHDTYELSIQ